MKTLLLASACALSVLTGCSSTQKIEHARTDAVKRVAIIGFGVQQVQPIDGQTVALAMLGGNDDKNTMTVAPNAIETAMADAMYDDLAKELSKTTGWQVVPHHTLTKNQAYRILHDNKMKGMQPRPYVHKNTEVYVPEGVIEGFVLGNFSPAQRAALIKDLGVDAVAIVTLDSQLLNEGNMFQKMVATGKYRREVGIRFAMYDRNGEDAIWFDGKSRAQFKGEASTQVFGFSSKDELSNQSFQTAHYTFDQVMQAYKKM